MQMAKVRLLVRQLTRLSSGYGYVTPSCELPRPVPVLIPLFGAARLEGVALGNGFVVGVYRAGPTQTLCSYGVNRALQLGASSANPDFGKKTWVLEQNVVKLRSGRAHTLLLGEEGGVMGFGSNNLGQLGVSRVESEVPFRQLHLRDKVVDIATGLDNSFLLTSEGVVLSCGWSADGQTGSGSTSTIDQFTEVSIPGRVVRVDSSGDSALAVCDNGDVYGWGNNEYHQVSPAGDMQVTSPAKIPLPEPVSQVAAGGSFSLFLTHSGVLYSCGYGPGTGQGAAQLLPTPTHVPLPAPLATLTASLDHAAGVTQSGQFIRWGRGLQSKLVSLTDQDMTSPQVLDSLQVKVVGVVCGVNKTCLITDTPIKSVSNLGMLEPREGEEIDEEDYYFRI